MFLYTNNEPSKKEIKKTVPFTIASKRIKYLGINLTKKVKDLYAKNYKLVMKEVKENTIEIHPSNLHRLEDIILLKCPYCPKSSTDSMQLPSKSQWHFFIGREKASLKFIQPQQTLNSKSNREKEEHS